MTSSDWLILSGIFASQFAMGGAIIAWIWANLGKRIDAKADKELTDRLDLKMDEDKCRLQHENLEKALALRLKETERMWSVIDSITKSLNRMELMMAGMAGKMGIAIPLDEK